MNLEDLESFRCVAREGSFTRASAQLHLSQPALSKRVQRLEKDLGVSLLDRSTTRVVLTPAGAQLIPQVEQLARLWQQVKTGVTGLAAPDDGTPNERIRLGVFVDYDGQVADHLTRAVPDLAVELHVVQPAEALERLATGGLDAATGYELPGMPAHPAVDGAHVWTVVSEPQWVVVGPDHALAEQDRITVEDVADAGLPWFISPAGDPVHAWERRFLTGRSARAELREATQSSLRQITLGQGAALASPQNRPNQALTLRPLVPVVRWHHFLTWMPERVSVSAALRLQTGMRGFHQRRAQDHPRYWQWIRDHAEQFPGLLPGEGS